MNNNLQKLENYNFLYIFKFLADGSSDSDHEGIQKSGITLSNLLLQ